MYLNIQNTTNPHFVFRKVLMNNFYPFHSNKLILICKRKIAQKEAMHRN